MLTVGTQSLLAKKGEIISPFLFFDRVHASMFAIYIRIPSRQVPRTPGVFYIPLPGIPSTEAPAEQRAGQEHRESGAGEPFLCSSSVRSEGNEYRTETGEGKKDPVQAEVQLWDE